MPLGYEGADNLRSSLIILDVCLELFNSCKEEIPFRKLLLGKDFLFLLLELLLLDNMVGPPPLGASLEHHDTGAAVILNTISESSNIKTKVDGDSTGEGTYRDGGGVGKGLSNLRIECNHEVLLLLHVLVPSLDLLLNPIEEGWAHNT